MKPHSLISAAFSGCGFLAPIHGGSACQLLESGYAFREVSGTSGGSIIAAAIGAGFNYGRIKNLSVNSDFKGLLRLDLWSLLKGVGYCSGDALERFLHGVLGDITFAKTFVDTRIVATDLKTGVPFVFSKETTPDYPLYKACRASASIPFIYETFSDLDKVFVDGGETCNVPAQYLPGGGKKVAFVIQSRKPNNLTTLLGRASANLSNLLSADEATLEALANAHSVKVVNTVCNSVGFLDDGMSEMDKRNLFSMGLSAAKGI